MKTRTAKRPGVDSEALTVSASQRRVRLSRSNTGPNPAQTRVRPDIASDHYDHNEAKSTPSEHEGLETRSVPEIGATRTRADLGVPRQFCYTRPPAGMTPGLRTKPRLPLKARTEQAAAGNPVIREGRAGDVASTTCKEARVDRLARVDSAAGHLAEGTDYAVTSRTGDRATPPEYPGDWLGSIRAAPGKSVKPSSADGEGLTPTTEPTKEIRR